MVTQENVDITSEELAKEAQQGSHKAFDALIRRHKSDGYRVALRMCGRPYDAEEILQISLERLFRHIGKYDISRPFRPWFLRIVSNQARTFLRIQKLKSLFFLEKTENIAKPVHKSGPDSQLHRGQVKSIVEQAILTLPVDQREAFIFKHIEGLSFDEMAEITGDSAGTLRVRAHRARQAVLEFLRDHNVTISAMDE